MAAAIHIKPIAGGFPGLGKRAPNAIVRVLNRVAASTRAAAVREIAGNLGAKQAAVREAVSVKRANFTTMEAQVIARGARISIYDLGARQTRAGVTYRSGGGRKLIPGAFIPRFRSGHAGVFKRAGRRRLPIRELFGPSIPLIFVRQKIQAALRTVIRTRMAVEMKAAARFYGGAE